MATIMPHEELVARALKWLDQSLRDAPNRDIGALLDEAGARFNLSPLDSQALLDLFQTARRSGRED